MNWATRTKLGLALAAAILFAGSLRTGDERLRWVAIGLLLAAILLRFLAGRRNGEDDRT